MVDSCSGAKGFSPSALVFPSTQKQTSIISDKLTCSKAEKDQHCACTSSYIDKPVQIP